MIKKLGNLSKLEKISEFIFTDKCFLVCAPNYDEIAKSFEQSKPHEEDHHVSLMLPRNVNGINSKSIQLVMAFNTHFTQHSENKINEQKQVFEFSLRRWKRFISEESFSDAMYTIQRIRSHLANDFAVFKSRVFCRIYWELFTLVLKQLLQKCKFQ